MGRSKTKVAVVVGSLEVGGAELDIVRNFPRLDRDEFDVVVVSFGTLGALGPELERRGIRVVARGRELLTLRPSSVGRTLRKVAYTTGVVRWLGCTLNAEQADIVHFFLPHAYGYGMLACMLMRPKAKRVMSRLSLNFYSREHKPLTWLETRLLHRSVDVAIGNSQVILDELAEEGVDPAKLRLLYNGIDPAPFAYSEGDRARAREALGIDSEAFVMLAVGNLYAYKGHADLIEACSRISGRLPAGWRLLVAGRDEEGNKAAYEKLVAERGLAETIRFLGPWDDVAGLLAAADVFVQPSHHEGLPNAVVEAMAASLPVVATAVGGVPEAVTAGSSEETGWLVPPRDPDVLAAVLLEAAEDPQRRARMGELARKRVLAQFSLDKSVSTYEAVYRDLSS